jgi:hypothetical protein
MDLVMLVVALFIFFFGSVIALRTFEAGLRLGDNSLKLCGWLLKIPFKLIFKLTIFAAKLLVKKYSKQDSETILVKPLFVVTPLELQQMQQNKLVQSGRRPPVLIEHPPQKSN